MSDSDLFISNGTCYFATNRKAAETFIPCGNAANAAYTCCLKGDVCLEGSVCFHPDGMMNLYKRPAPEKTHYGV